eukprot:g10017.t1
MIRNWIGKLLRAGRGSNAVAKDHGAELNEMMEKFAGEIPNAASEDEGKEFSLEEVKRKAEEGDPDFQYHWGLVLQHGREGVIERDPRSALQLMAESARQGHPWARYNLANAFLTGVDGILEPDHEQSFKLFKLCTEGQTEIPSAFAHVGNMYQNGIGTDKNEERAIQYFHTAADMGDVNSKAVLAELAFELRKRDIEQNNVPDEVSKEQVEAVKRKIKDSK